MFDLYKYIKRHVDWSSDVFGPGERTTGITKHIEKELKEVRENPTDAYEWADVIILAIDGATRAGITPGELCDILQRKQDENKNRSWPDWRLVDKDEPIEHVKG